MRRIPLTSAAIAEAVIHCREHGKPETEAQLRHFASLREPMPPSRAHLKRLAKDRSRPYVDPVVHKPVSARTLVMREQNEWFKRGIAQLGGSRWVDPGDGTHYEAASRELYTIVQSPNNEEQTARSFAEHMAEEQRKIDAMRERLRAAAAKVRDETPTRLSMWAGRVNVAAFDEAMGR